jgi:hypothetical protein
LKEYRITVDTRWSDSVSDDFMTLINTDLTSTTGWPPFIKIAKGTEATIASPRSHRVRPWAATPQKQPGPGRIGGSHL